MPTTNFIWDELSDNVLLETDETDTLTARYTNRPEQFGRLISQYRIEDEKIVERFYHYDGESSTRDLTDANETVTDTFIYTAYGEEVARTGTTTNPFGYKGAVGYYTNEETNDIYVRNRTYEPAMGCWLSADPLGFVDGPNRYRAYFVPGGIDPSGFISCGECSISAMNPADVTMDCNIFRMTDDPGEFFWGFEFKTYLRFDGDCWCCEYRQYVRMAVYTISFKMPDGRVRHCERLRRVPPPPRFEDVDTETGNPYGHRMGYENVPGDNYTPERLTGCEYNASDTPGVPNLVFQKNVCLQDPRFAGATHFRVSVFIAFDFEVIDTCNNDKVIWKLAWEKTCLSEWVGLPWPK